MDGRATVIVVSPPSFSVLMMRLSGFFASEPNAADAHLLGCPVCGGAMAVVVVYVLSLVPSLVGSFAFFSLLFGPLRVAERASPQQKVA